MLLSVISRKRKMKRILWMAGVVLCFFLPEILLAAGPEGNLYPTPTRLFHIARSVNRNLVCYDVRLSDGRLDTKEPMEVYWMNREEHEGQRGGLSFIQRKLAYGYDVVDKGDDSSVVTLTAYPARQLEIVRDGERYVCRTIIGGQPAVLQWLYVKASDWNPLAVEYVELHGQVIATGEEAVERVKR